MGIIRNCRIITFCSVQLPSLGGVGGGLHAPAPLGATLFVAPGDTDACREEPGVWIGRMKTVRGRNYDRGKNLFSDGVARGQIWVSGRCSFNNCHINRNG
jgi:hypothetical protein